MRQLSGVDALHILEETPGQHMHTIKLAIVGPGPDGPVSVEAIKQWARERLPQIPAMRWTVVKIPLGLGRPVFLDAGAFDVDRHISVERVRTGDPAEFDELVSRIASEQLSRERPLWELTIVQGLPDDQIGMIFKIHHAVMDGQASVRFFELAFDSEVPLDFGPVPAQAEPTPTKPGLVKFALRSQAHLYGQLPHVARRTLASGKENRARKASGAPAVVNPMSGPSTRFNRLPLPERIYVDVSVPLSRIMALKTATSATVNDVFVTLCGGAIRRYLKAHGETPDKCLNIAHPVSLRQPDEIDNFGNRTSYWYVAIGTDVEDPIERLAAVKGSIDAAREWAKGDTELFAVWQDYYLLFGKMTLKILGVAEKLSKKPLFNAVVSNVRGPRPLSIAGAPVVAVRSMGPITRVLGLNFTAWSYGDIFSIGVQSCRDFMPDLRVMAEHIEAELEAFEKLPLSFEATATAHDGPMIDQTETQVRIERTIDADVAEVFAILSDPRRHVDIDGSGTVRADQDASPISAVGQMFTMSMSHPKIGDYTTENYIVEFEPGHRITWETTRPGTPPRGFRWGWEVTEVAPNRTAVVHTYDWSRVTDEEVLARVQFPFIAATDINATVTRLAAAASTT